LVGLFFLEYDNGRNRTLPISRSPPTTMEGIGPYRSPVALAVPPTAVESFSFGPFRSSVALAVPPTAVKSCTIGPYRSPGALAIPPTAVESFAIGP
jgi:hypothetical protein